MIFHPKRQKVYVPLVVENTAIKQIEENKFFQCYYWSAHFQETSY